MRRLRQTGFTIIEIMIVVAIIAIMAAIAIPQYTDYVRRGKIPEGSSALLGMRVRMEQFFQDNRSYNPAAVVAPACPIAVQNTRYFTITCTVLTATTYTLQAAGQGDLAGLALTLTQDNARASTVSAGPLVDAGYTGNTACWVTRKGGVC